MLSFVEMCLRNTNSRLDKGLASSTALMKSSNLLFFESSVSKLFLPRAQLLIVARKVENGIRSGSSGRTGP